MLSTTVVSILATRKPREVSFLELKGRKPCVIVPLMKRDAEIGKVVRNLRQAAGETVQQLADFLDVEKSMVSKKERGLESSFNDDELDRIARRYGRRRWMIHALAEGEPERKIELAEAYPHLSEGTVDDLLSIRRGKAV